SSNPIKGGNMTNQKQRQRNLPSKSRSNILLGPILLLVILLFTVGAFIVSASRESARRQPVLLVTLQSSERILEDVPLISGLAPAASLNDKQIYVIRQDLPGITVYDVERKRSKDILPFGWAAKALAIGSQGRMYLASESELRIIEPT